MTTWTYASSKLGNIKPETRSIAKELFEVAQRNGHDVWFIWGMGSSSEHRTGLALDLMVRNKAAGDFVRDYIWTHRKRLRLRHVIWWQTITSTVVSPGVVRQMADRGNDTKNHKDHIHVWFYAGTYQPPKVARPPTSTTNPHAGFVKQFQSLFEVKTDGKWGPNTDARALTMRNASWSNRGWPQNRRLAYNVKIVQSVVDVKTDGVWGDNTQAALIEWIKDFQRLVGVKQDGWWGPVTDGKFLTRRRRYRNNY